MASDSLSEESVLCEAVEASLWLDCSELRLDEDAAEEELGTLEQPASSNADKANKGKVRCFMGASSLFVVMKESYFRPCLISFFL